MQLVARLCQQQLILVLSCMRYVTPAFNKRISTDQIPAGLMSLHPFITVPRLIGGSVHASCNITDFSHVQAATQRTAIRGAVRAVASCKRMLKR